jgi:hypothetical protein
MAVNANELGVTGSSPMIGKEEQVNSQNDSMIGCNEVSTIVRYEEKNDDFRYYPELVLLTDFVRWAKFIFPKDDREEIALHLIKTAHAMRDKNQPIVLIWFCIIEKIIWRILLIIAKEVWKEFLFRILDYLFG